MKQLIVLIAICSLIVSCVKPDATRRTLENAGYTNIEIIGWRPFTCGEDDDFSTGFKATAQSGKNVTGVVCSGLLKGNTIRTD